MEVMILSCGTGGGHNTAGKAVAEELEQRGHAVTFLDPFQLAGKHTAAHVGNSYIRLVQRSPKSFGLLYSLGEEYRRLPVRSPVYWANGKMAAQMQRFLKEHPFDAIVMTHLFPAQMLAHLPKEALPQTMLVATDYTCIPFAEETDCDWYIIPSPALAGEFSARHIPAEKTRAYGIPVRAAFCMQKSREEACAELGLQPQKHYILLSGGSIGVGKLAAAAKSMQSFLTEEENYGLIIVCGKNQRLYQSLQAEYANSQQVQVLESTTQMAAYLKASDLFISKPGGLSSTEAAVSGIPLIHISPIPGCETHNASFFAERGMSLLVEQPEQLPDAVRQLQSSGAARRMIEAQCRWINRKAAADICDLLEQTTKKV